MSMGRSVEAATSEFSVSRPPTVPVCDYVPVIGIFWRHISASRVLPGLMQDSIACMNLGHLTFLLWTNGFPSHFAYLDIIVISMTNGNATSSYLRHAPITLSDSLSLLVSLERFFKSFFEIITVSAWMTSHFDMDNKSLFSFPSIVTNLCILII
jgi:hypothetical protein